jgi:hypothetical protein
MRRACFFDLDGMISHFQYDVDVNFSAHGSDRVASGHPCCICDANGTKQHPVRRVVHDFTTVEWYKRTNWRASVVAIGFAQ